MGCSLIIEKKMCLLLILMPLIKTFPYTMEIKFVGQIRGINLKKVGISQKKKANVYTDYQDKIHRKTRTLSRYLVLEKQPKHEH